MIESFVDIGRPDGTMTTFVVHPDVIPGEQDGPWPVVLFLMDAPGMREELRNMSRRLASAGYYVMASQLYYRDVDHYNLFETGDRDRMMELMSHLSNAMVVDDAGAMISYAEADPAADASRVGTVGYCMSGPFTIMVAAAYADRVKAAASVHGVRLAVDADDSPHRALPQVTGEVYVACAEHDPYAPSEMIDELEKAMAGAGSRGRVEWYPGTEHGFAFAERPAYVREASERHWERLHALFRRNLHG
ncbi:MAG: dienelactone hydrolase family protein [Acidimicrobiia bacterium]|nr:dienelactone hydrolase family protein [Acidimicrobiia bacterium]